MALASDADGFLTGGQPLDLGAALELWRAVRADIASIKELLRSDTETPPDPPREAPQRQTGTSVAALPTGRDAGQGDALARALEAVASLAPRQAPESPAGPNRPDSARTPERPFTGVAAAVAGSVEGDRRTQTLLGRMLVAIGAQEDTLDKGIKSLVDAIEDLTDATRWAKDKDGGGLLGKLPGMLGKAGKLAGKAGGAAAKAGKGLLGKAGGLLKKIPIKGAGPLAAILGAVGLAQDWDAADKDETLTERGRKVRKGEATGKFGGLMGGSAAGAMAGAVAGPPGMLVGGLIGGIIGAWGGSKAGGALTDAVLTPEAPGTLPGPARTAQGASPGAAQEMPAGEAGVPQAAPQAPTQADRRASRSGGASATATGKGKQFSPEVEQVIADASATHGVSPEFMRSMAAIESNGNPNAVSPTGATGLYQFTKGTGRQYGLMGPGGDQRKDARANADAAARLANDNKRSLQRMGIENPTDHDLYMAHQQGAGGWAKIKKGNITPEIRRNMDHNAGRGKSPEEFVAHWEKTFAQKVASTGYDVNDGMIVKGGGAAPTQAATGQPAPAGSPAAPAQAQAPAQTGQPAAAIPAAPAQAQARPTPAQAGGPTPEQAARAREVLQSRRAHKNIDVDHLDADLAVKVAAFTEDIEAQTGRKIQVQSAYRPPTEKEKATLGSVGTAQAGLGKSHMVAGTYASMHGRGEAVDVKFADGSLNDMNHMSQADKDRWFETAQKHDLNLPMLGGEKGKGRKGSKTVEWWHLEPNQTANGKRGDLGKRGTEYADHIKSRSLGAAIKGEPQPSRPAAVPPGAMTTVAVPSAAAVATSPSAPPVPSAPMSIHAGSSPAVTEPVGRMGGGYGERKDDNTPVVGGVTQDVRDRRVAHIVTGGIGATL